MQDAFNDDQRMLDDAVNRYLERAYPAPAGRPPVSVTSAPSESPHWQAWVDMGLVGLALPSEAGGMDGRLEELCIVMQRFGQYLAVECYDSSAVLAGQVLRRLPDSVAAHELLAQLAAGSATPVLAHTESQGDTALASIQTQAAKVDGGWVLNGAKRCVAWGGNAGQLLVSAATDRDAALFLVPAGSPGLVCTSAIGLDARPYADIELNGCRVAQAHYLGRAAPALDVAQDVARVALCAEAVGAMQALLTVTTEYVRARHQFNRPLGSFQAIQHRLVDMLMLLEQARSLMWLAAATDPSDSRFARLASAAKAKCGEAARFIGEQAIHLHGGMGMTDELPVGHYVKRLLAIEYTLGTTRQHLARYRKLALEENAEAR
ncbi:acyl-CoA dehydrogenase family protein [Pusillimonas sp. SM2304]|uniref:acyl-CoA dehydrogenase family protein n=1 Tax=Pusillimonas sp. SM2304 TaxID=3073241 RepID=UPI0028768E76|nr:acyl-CoA dehydrogenase family protein [Pusillimonas sp. SM2304]MDS1139207.1 acyl-CoA dehydrogenase family protein [Pusillimonas sp. SM2304]